MYPGGAERQLDRIGGGSFRISAKGLGLAVGVTAAFIIRYLLIPADTVINGDGVYYTILGERFASGDFAGGISAYWSPLYSVLTGIFSPFFNDREFGGRVVSLIAGALLIIPGYYLIEEFFGWRAAAIGCVLLVFHPFLIQGSGWVMTESLYTLIFTTCLLYGWYALSRADRLAYLLTGLLLGAAFLTKPEAVGYLGLVLVLMIVAKLFSTKEAFSGVLINYSIVLLGFAIFFLPYVFHLKQKTGEWTISQKIAVNLPAIDYEGDLLALTSDGRMTMMDRIWGDDYETDFRAALLPAEKATPKFELSQLSTTISILGLRTVALLKKQVRDYFPAVLPLPFLIIATVGLFRRSWTRSRAAKEIFLLGFVVCTLAGYAASSVELRYLFPLVPILIAWVASGAVEFGQWLTDSIEQIAGRRYRAVNVNIASAFTLALLLASFTPLFLAVFGTEEPGRVPYEEKVAGLWIKDQGGTSNPVVMSANILPAFYAGAKHLYLPDEDFSTVLEYARRRRVDYIVFSKRRSKTIRDFPTDDKARLLDLKLLYRQAIDEKREVLVYELDKRGADSLSRNERPAIQ